eukprot:242872-Lingulodinium_polyedra.AAC.1
MARATTSALRMPPPARGGWAMTAANARAWAPALRLLATNNATCPTVMALGKRRGRPCPPPRPRRAP